MPGIQLKYFVVKPAGTSAHAEASRRAIAAYAVAIFEHDKELALDLISWICIEDREALDKLNKETGLKHDQWEDLT